jgi:hypothetical protein
MFLIMLAVNAVAAWAATKLIGASTVGSLFLVPSAARL